jgi:hypothetical protein
MTRYDHLPIWKDAVALTAVLECAGDRPRQYLSFSNRLPMQPAARPGAAAPKD